MLFCAQTLRLPQGVLSTRSSIGGAERITAGADDLRREAKRGDPPLEGVDLGDDPVAQALDVVVGRAVLDLHDEIEKRRRGIDQRVQALERRQLERLPGIHAGRQRE